VIGLIRAGARYETANKNSIGRISNERELTGSTTELLRHVVSEALLEPAIASG